VTAVSRLPAGIGEVIFSPDEIAQTVGRLAAEIARDLAGKQILLLGILKGSFFFTADLARSLPSTADVTIDFLCVSSYGNSDRSSGEVRLLKDTSESVEGKNVIIVEDIVDNGLTLAYLHRLLGGRHPASLRTCVLLDKPYRRKLDIPVDYVGFRCPDTFVVGYGLDYQERFRNLPYVAGLAFGESA
jgi:hypoxanthine phosphoribosyltransferase